MDNFSEILLTDLRDGVRNFNKLLVAGLLFAAGGHFFVVEPYFRYKANEQEVSRDLTNATNALTQLIQEVEPLEHVTQEVTQTLAEVRTKIRDYPNHLRSVLPEIHHEVDPTPLSPAQRTALRRVDVFEMPAEIHDYEAGVHWYVETWFAALTNQLEKGLVLPLSLETNSVFTVLHLKEKSQYAFEALSRKLSSLPTNFWKEYESKMEVGKELQDVVEKFFNPVEESALTVLKTEQVKLSDQQSKIKDLQAKSKEYETRKAELVSRLELLESPLGRLPVGLTDLIVLFPFLLTGFIVTLTIGVIKTHNLRVTVIRQQRPAEDSAQRTAFDLCTACWFLPPYSGAPRALLLPALLTLFAVLAVRGGYLAQAYAETDSPAEFGTQLPRGHTLIFLQAICGVMTLICLIWLGRVLFRKGTGD